MAKRKRKKSKIVEEPNLLLLEDTASEEGVPLEEQTMHIVQPFRMVTSKGHKSTLTPVDPLSVISEDAARERAERMFETGSYAGIDAYTVTGNPDIGEYGEPVFHVRLGNVPFHEVGSRKG